MSIEPDLASDPTSATTLPQLIRRAAAAYGDATAIVYRSDAGPETPIRIDRQTYRRGLVIHSRTRLTYRLNGEFQRFVAVAGIEQLVRPRGDLDLVITGDVKVLFRRNVNGTDAPIPLDLSVTGVRELTIFVDFAGERRQLLTWRESPSDPPNAFLRTLGDAQRAAPGEAETASTLEPVTRFPDPTPLVREIKKRLVTYKRRDGVDLSFTLYTPPGYTEGTRVPAIPSRSQSRISVSAVRPSFCSRAWWRSRPPKRPAVLSTGATISGSREEGRASQASARVRASESGSSRPLPGSSAIGSPFRTG